ncbi:MAG TPA: hypothetical protein VEY13_04325 [Rubrobacteraceae bacterium]|nr:hypothetical protein [Rubrobacteraceae bacterium]
MGKDDTNLFPLGRTIVSKNALAVLGEAGEDPKRLFERHAAGDWGVVESKSWYLNRMAVDCGYGSIASAYAVLDDVRVVILTQPDRRNTVMALPDEIQKLLGRLPR